MLQLDRKNAMIFLALLVMMPPNALTSITIIKNLFNLAQAIFFAYFALNIILNRKYSPILILGILYSAVVLCATINRGEEIVSGFVYVMDVVGFLFLLEYLMFDGYRLTIRRLNNYYFSLCAVNYVYFIVNYYLRGYSLDNSLFITVKNSITSALIFAVVLSVLDDFYNKEGKVSAHSILLVLSLIHTEIIMGSGTGTVGFFILVIYIFASMIRNNLIKVNFKALLIIGIGSFALIVVFRVQEVFSFLIERVLGKDLTFTGRTAIWDYYIERIRESWIIGYGVEYRPFHEYGQHVGAHDGYLDIMLYGGVVALAIVITIVLIAGSKIKQYGDSKSVNLLAVAIFSFQIMMITETPSIIYLFAMCTLCWFSGEEQETCLEITHFSDTV